MFVGAVGNADALQDAINAARKPDEWPRDKGRSGHPFLQLSRGTTVGLAVLYVLDKVEAGELKLDELIDRVDVADR